MSYRILIVLCFLVLVGRAQAQSSTQQSNLEANIPEAKNFYAFLKRDVHSYLKTTEPEISDLLQIDLLRDAPTQSGVSYPKYYAWVKYRVGAVQIKQGVLRLAAIDKVRFEVTNFVSNDEAKQDKKSVEQNFPAALVPDILIRAAKP